MNIITDPVFYAVDAINYLEKKYKVKYVFEHCIKTKDDQWSEIPSLIFYTKKVYPKGSNYLAVTKTKGHNVILSNGISAIGPFDGILADNGDIIYSHYRHHLNQSNDGSVWIDGGRDYIRTNNYDRVLSLSVIYDKIVLTEKFSNDMTPNIETQE